MEEYLRGSATQQLLDTGFIARPTGLSKLWGAIRPGPMQDALAAADNVSAGTIGKLHGLNAVPKIAKIGGPLLVAGAGVGLFIKHQMDVAKKAQAEAQTKDTQLQGALQQFAQLPPDQQQQMLQQQQALLEQAAAQPNLTAAQQQEIQARTAELQQFAQVAAGGSTGAGSAGMQVQQPEATAPAASTGGFTPQGLGLA
jgi:hypothetical protein